MWFKLWDDTTFWEQGPTRCFCSESCFHEMALMIQDLPVDSWSLYYWVVDVAGLAVWHMADMDETYACSPPSNTSLLISNKCHMWRTGFHKLKKRVFAEDFMPKVGQNGCGSKLYTSECYPQWGNFWRSGWQTSKLWHYNDFTPKLGATLKKWQMNSWELIFWGQNLSW